MKNMYKYGDRLDLVVLEGMEMQNFMLSLDLKMVLSMML